MEVHRHRASWMVREKKSGGKIFFVVHSSMRKIPDVVKLGRWQLGWRYVNVFVKPKEIGASFNFCLEGEEAQMSIGLQYDDFRRVVDSLMHETMEMSMVEQGCSFTRTDAWERNVTDAYTFHMNHSQFTEATTRASWFMCNVMEDLRKAYNKYHRE